MNICRSRKYIIRSFPGLECSKQIENILHDYANAEAIFYSQFENPDPYIPNASYIVGKYEIENRMNDLRFSPSAYTEYVVFCEANGRAIMAAPSSIGESRLLKMLDPNAEKPMIFYYRKCWWPAYYIAFGLTKGCPGYFVISYDANGCRVASTRIQSYDAVGNELANFPPNYNYTNAIALQSDYSKKRKTLFGMVAMDYIIILIGIFCVGIFILFVCGFMILWELLTKL